MKKVPIEDNVLELKNSGDLSLFFIGIGSAFSKIHNQTNLLIVKGDDHLLVDCGMVCPMAMWNLKSNVMNIENVMVTHSHADHVGGLEEMALMGRYVTKRRPKVIITNEYKEVLWNETLMGGCAYGECHDGKYLTFDDYFEQVEPKRLENVPRPVYEANIGSINVKVFRTMHVPDCAKSWEDSFYSYGVVIDDRIVYPSDTRFDKPMFDWLLETYPIEMIFHDCQFYTGGVHASYQELKSLPQEVKNKMYLCHYGDNYQAMNPKDDGFAGFAEQGVYYNFKANKK